MAITVTSSGDGYVANNLPERIYESTATAHIAALQFAREGTVNTTGLISRREDLARQRFASGLERQEVGESRPPKRGGRPPGKAAEAEAKFLAGVPSDIWEQAKKMAKEGDLPAGIYFEPHGEGKPGRYLFKRVTKDVSEIKGFSEGGRGAEMARTLAIAAKLMHEAEHGALQHRRRVKPAPELPSQSLYN
ncbi:hypothetical protein [Pigmentiphaga kullae]|nr:hypothetical protein [Pigmentiphaga kullae]